MYAEQMLHTTIQTTWSMTTILYIHKPVWLVVRGDSLYQEKEPGNQHDNFAAAIIKI